MFEKDVCRITDWSHDEKKAECGLNLSLTQYMFKLSQDSQGATKADWKTRERFHWQWGLYGLFVWVIRRRQISLGNIFTRVWSILYLITRITWLINCLNFDKPQAKSFPYFTSTLFWSPFNIMIMDYKLHLKPWVSDLYLFYQAISCQNAFMRIL